MRPGLSTPLLLAMVGSRLIALIAARLLDHGRQELWTLHSQLLVQAGRGLATLGWLTLVGVFAWWCRVRRLWTVVPRLWWRRPVGALLLHLLLALATLLTGAAVLFAWRQSAAGASGWAVLWLAVLAGLSFVWHWRLRAGRGLWSSPDLIDLRAIPDSPWGLTGRLLRWPRRRRRAAPAATEPADA